MGLLTEDDLASYAEIMVWAVRTSRAVPFKNGELVLLRFDMQALPLAEAVYAALMDAHLHPLPQALPTSFMQVQHFGNSSFGQLTFAQPGLDELFRATAGVITILAPDDLGSLSGVDEHSIDQGEKSELAAMALLDRRRRAGLLGSTVCLYPTPALAEASGMPLEEYAERLARACLLYTPDPLRQWMRVRQELADIAKWLDSLKIESLRIESTHMDLTLSPGSKRRFVGVTGRNIPGYELYLAPDWRTVNGVYYADQPSIRWGRLVSQVRLEFHGGVAISAQAGQGEPFLAGRLASDGGARRVGEFSLTDKRISRVERFMAHTLLDENYGGEDGNCHIALGGSSAASFAGPAQELTAERAEELGFNSSGMHWDLVNTQKKRVTASLAGGGKRAIYEDGQFLL
ncbi:MAG TPA: aminopeptidase [Humidesulfovibrio sp.]|uniref:aminopeptidase n=1 Tax=Humidesulfovibrio sp. TaxID=2910988 RepID=UPI002C55DA52|nr:aminopeptidase [Humidesulfovibrio sp.]HWR04940.1 aminopeptidase [Humidesulfovibrio sp.]